jgi:hypothetical protein
MEQMHNGKIPTETNSQTIKRAMDGCYYPMYASIHCPTYFNSNLLVFLSESASKVDTRRAPYLLFTLHCALATSLFILDCILS